MVFTSKHEFAYNVLLSSSVNIDQSAQESFVLLLSSHDDAHCVISVATCQINLRSGSSVTFGIVCSVIINCAHHAKPTCCKAQT